MSDANEDFCRLMCRVREGSEDAAWELVEQYGELIRRAVRRVLNEKMRPKFDSLDFVQLVWQSFFRLRDEADRFAGPQQLAAFLVGMARNKVLMETRRRLRTEKYDVRRERPWGETTDEEGCRSRPRYPAPLDVVMARELWDRMLQDQPVHHRRIIQLKLQGHSCCAIGTALHLDEQTVRRFLKKLSFTRLSHD
jgi:RNA polymerase sigma-70 factor (ECF subfamily)